MIKQSQHISGLRFSRVGRTWRPIGFSRSAKSPQIHGNDRGDLHKARKHTPPVIPEARPAVKQEHRWAPLSSPHIMQFQSISIMSHFMPPSSILRKDIKHLIHRHSSFPFHALNDFLPTHFILPQRSVCTQRTHNKTFRMGALASTAIWDGYVLWIMRLSRNFAVVNLGYVS